MKRQIRPPIWFQIRPGVAPGPLLPRLPPPLPARRNRPLKNARADAAVGMLFGFAYLGLLVIWSRARGSAARVVRLPMRL
jgi:hypothetical protein